MWHIRADLRQLLSRHGGGFAVLAAVAALCIPATSGVAAPVVDPGYRPVFSAPASVEGVVALPGGQVLVHGDLVTVNGTAVRGIARINANGTLDTTFQLSPELQADRIYAVAVQPDGKILIGGQIVRYGPTASRNYLFRLNADGSWDAGFDAGGFTYAGGTTYGLNGAVRSLLVEPGGKIVVGGEFTAPHNRITRLEASGAVDATFNPGTGADASVTRLARQSTGHLVLGGEFTTLNGAAKAGVARVTATGTLDATAFGPGIYGGSLMALAVQPDDRVLIGGSFTMAGGVDAPKMARFSAAGAVESAFNPYIRGYLEQVTSLLAFADRIIVGGWNPVMYFNGKPTDHNAEVFALQAGDGGFVGYVPFAGKPTDVWGLAVRGDGTVVAVGSFTQRDDPADTATYAGICLLTGQYFQPDAAFRPLAGGVPEVRALAIQPDGRVVAGGNFYLVDGVRKNNLARLNADGSLDAALSPPSTAGGVVNGVLVRSDGRIVVGGSFYSVANQDYRDVALLSPTGTVEASVYAGGVSALAAYPGDKTVAGLYNAPGIRRLNADLSIESAATFNPGGITNVQQPDLEFDRVNAVAVQPDGKILVGGSFATFSGAPRQNIVRLNADGSLDADFASPAFTVYNFRSEVFAIALQPDGKIVIAGRFSTVGGAASPTVARLNANGSVDTGFVTPFLDQGSSAYALHVQADGRILVGGSLQLIEGNAIYNNIVRLMPGGARDTTFSSTAVGAVKAFASAAASGGTSLYIGGALREIDAAPRIGMARMVESTLAVTAQPGSLAFGGQSMNTTAPAKPVTITNTSGASVDVTALTATASFSVSHDCATLAAGGTCTAWVAFTPATEGGIAGTLTIATGVGSQFVALVGTGERSLTTHYYRSILRRAPDDGGKEYWNAEAIRVQKLGVSVNEVWFAMAQQFYTSAEYLAFGRDNASFAADLYNTFFNRAPDVEGLAYWKGQLDAGMPREVMLSAFMFSPEFVNFTRAIFGDTAVRAEANVVTDFYRGLLSRLPDDGGFAFWLAKFRAAQCASNAGNAVNAEVESISALFANSPEYTNRGRNDSQYVGDLYNAFLRRGGDLAGVQFWISQITTQARSRENVRQAFVASPEFQARVAAIIAQGCLQ